MCCHISTQDRIRMIANFSLILSITSTILGGVHHLLQSNTSLEKTNINNNATNISCEITLQKKCNRTNTDVYDKPQNEMGIQVMLTLFLIFIDLPASMLLLIGANLKIKQLLVPWMVTMALKMFGYVISCCLFVQFVLVKIMDENMGFGMKHYTKPTNNTNEQHFSIFTESAIDNVVQKRYFQTQIITIYHNHIVINLLNINYTKSNDFVNNKFQAAR